MTLLYLIPGNDEKRLATIIEDNAQLNEQYRILLCRLCKAAIWPGAGIEPYFRQEHQLKGKVLKDIKDYYSALELAGPKLVALPENKSPAIELLTILNGYSCAACRYLTVARDNIVRHWREAEHGTAAIRWTEVRLQTHWELGRAALDFLVDSS